MSAEIDPWQLKCNACWKVIDSPRSYRTRCNHLYCRGCAERFFSKAMLCPVCDRDVDGEFGVVELCHELNSDIMTLFFSFVAIHTAEASNLCMESNKFVREQLALYGTREAFLRIEEGREVSDELKTSQAQLKHSLEENAALMARLEESSRLLQEKDRQLKHTLDAYNSLKANSSTPLAARRGSDALSVRSSSSLSSEGLSTRNIHNNTHISQSGHSSSMIGERTPYGRSGGGSGEMRSMTADRPSMMQASPYPHSSAPHPTAAAATSSSSSHAMLHATAASHALRPSGGSLSGGRARPETLRPRSGEPVSTAALGLMKHLAQPKHPLATPSRASPAARMPASGPLHRSDEGSGGYVQTKQGGVRLVQRPPTAASLPQTPRR